MTIPLSILLTTNIFTTLKNHLHLQFEAGFGLEGTTAKVKFWQELNWLIVWNVREHHALSQQSSDPSMQQFLVQWLLIAITPHK